MPRSALHPFALLSVTAVAGCLAPQPRTPMRATDLADPLASAPAHFARVVFEAEAAVADTRTTDASPDFAPVHVADASGHLLGDIGWRTWFAVDLTPGEHLFFAWDDALRVGGTQVFVLRATVRDGHNYYVRVAHERRAFTYGGRPGAPLLVRAPAPLDALPVLVARQTDPNSADDWAASNRAEIAHRLAAGQASVARGDFAVLGADDGFVFRRAELD